MNYLDKIKKHIDKLFLFSIVAVVFGITIDSTTTVLFHLDSNVKEANPLVKKYIIDKNYSFIRFISIKTAAFGTFVLIMEKFTIIKNYENPRKISTIIVGLFFAIIWGGAGIYNMFLLS